MAGDGVRTPGGHHVSGSTFKSPRQAENHPGLIVEEEEKSVTCNLPAGGDTGM